VTIQWCSDTTEALSYISNDEEAIAMLPQPFVTAALAQVEDLRVALDLNDAWDALDTGCEIVTGVIVVRTEFAEEHPDLVETFLDEYEASMDYAAENPAENAELIEKYGIVAKAAIAEKALPGCHLNLETGEEMYNSMSGYLQILFDENPASIGGSLPEDNFYYGF
jgi:NitT/TauT family transport system substrate-binding protein